MSAAVANPPTIAAVSPVGDEDVPVERRQVFDGQRLQVRDGADRAVAKRVYRGSSSRAAWSATDIVLSSACLMAASLHAVSPRAVRVKSGEAQRIGNLETHGNPRPDK